MGLLTIIKKQALKDREVRVLVLGLDNAGKTTIIRSLLGEDVSTISPTMGFQINTIFYGNYNLNFWDIGGQMSLRSFWGNYFDNTKVVVWVVDALAIERIAESYQELRTKVILQDRLVGVYLLVVINKIDLIAKEQHGELQNRVVQLLNLEQEIPATDKWNVISASGKTGAGTREILDWIVDRQY